MADCADRARNDFQKQFGGEWNCIVNNHYFSDIFPYTGNAYILKTLEVRPKKYEIGFQTSIGQYSVTELLYLSLIHI